MGRKFGDDWLMVWEGILIGFTIAGFMYVSIVITALILNGTFSLMAIVPEGGRAVSEVAQVGIDYTLWMNLVSVLITVTMIIFRRRHQQMEANADHQMDHDHNDGITLKRIVSMLCAFLLAGWRFIF